MRRRGAVLLGVAAIVASWPGCAPRNQYAPPPPPAVTVALPIQRPVTEWVELSGYTQAKARVDLRARVNGYLRSIDFQDGATVEAGKLLFVIDKEPFEAALVAAQAKRAEADANLKAARESKKVAVAQAALLISQAQSVVAQLNETRGRRLLERGVQSREEYDQQEAALKTAQADVEARRADLEQAKVDYATGIALGQATLDKAEADVTDAELQLSYTEVRAPIGGRIGRHLVDLGNLVQAETTLLATIEAYDPLYVYFTISEAQALYFSRLRQQGKLPPLGSVPIALHMALADEEDFPHEGLFDFAELGLDPETGTTLRRGIFPNPGGTIVPGLFARVRGAVGDPSPRLLVPERALGEDQQGRYVLVVNDQDVVEHRSVRTGIQVEQLRVIEQGLQGDERVVVNGLLRARPGAKVAPQAEDTRHETRDTRQETEDKGQTDKGQTDEGQTDEGQKAGGAGTDREPTKPDGATRPGPAPGAAPDRSAADAADAPRAP